MKNRIVSLLLVLAMLLSLTACSPKENTPTDPTTPTSDLRIFTDDAGREMEIPAEITRIVPSGPLAQMLLLGLAPELFVGIASRWNASAEAYLPDAYYRLPYLGQLYDSADMNVEALAAADPQIIIDMGQPKNSVSEDMQTLQSQTGIPTVFISATLETMPQTYRKLGALLGKEEKAEKLAQFCEKVYARTLSIMEQVGKNKVNALYVLGAEGLNVIARGSYHAELMDLLTNNIAVVEDPSSKGLGNSVDMEQIALWNPEVVLFASGSIYSDVKTRDTWQEITAVADGQYLEIPDAPYNWMGNPPGVQRYLSLILLPAVLYPDYCDYDVKAEILEYYELFYDCHLTDAQYEALTAHAFFK